VAMSSKNWFGPVKGYSLLDQMTSRNLSTSSVEYVNVLCMMYMYVRLRSRTFLNHIL
jgi:hypothetical protein